jgi:hypothetical protein
VRLFLVLYFQDCLYAIRSTGRSQNTIQARMEKASYCSNSRYRKLPRSFLHLFPHPPPPPHTNTALQYLTLCVFSSLSLDFVFFYIDNFNYFIYMYYLYPPPFILSQTFFIFHSLYPPPSLTLLLFLLPSFVFSPLFFFFLMFLFCYRSHSLYSRSLFLFIFLLYLSSFFCSSNDNYHSTSFLRLLLYRIRNCAPEGQTACYSSPTLLTPTQQKSTPLKKRQLRQMNFDHSHRSMVENEEFEFFGLCSKIIRACTIFMRFFVVCVF